MRHNSINRRRKLNSNRDIEAFRQEAIDLQPQSKDSSWIYKHMSDDLYHFCVSLIQKAGNVVATYGYTVRLASIGDLEPVTNICDRETGKVLSRIGTDDEVAFITDGLEAGYTPDDIVKALVDWYLEEVNMFK